MDWNPLLSEEQLNEVISRSHEKLQVIFKHSTRCGVSSMVKNRLERSEVPENIDFNYLDLIRYRALSNAIANIFHVRHESPQVIVLKDGKAVYNESHSAILMEDIVSWNN